MGSNERSDVAAQSGLFAHVSLPGADRLIESHMVRLGVLFVVSSRLIIVTYLIYMLCMYSIVIVRSSMPKSTDPIPLSAPSYYLTNAI